jgi:hypothetical protein
MRLTYSYSPHEIENSEEQCLLNDQTYPQNLRKRETSDSYALESLHVDRQRDLVPTGPFGSCVNFDPKQDCKYPTNFPCTTHCHLYQHIAFCETCRAKHPLTQACSDCSNYLYKNVNGPLDLFYSDPKKGKEYSSKSMIFFRHFLVLSSTV